MLTTELAFRQKLIINAIQSKSMRFPCWVVSLQGIDVQPLWSSAIRNGKLDVKEIMAGLSINQEKASSEHCEPSEAMFILLAGWNTEPGVKPEVWPNKISHRWSSTLPCRLKGLFSSSMSTRSISMLCLARNTLPDSTLWSSLYFYFSIFHNYFILFIHFSSISILVFSLFLLLLVAATSISTST